MIIKKITEVPRIIYIIFVLIFFGGGGYWNTPYSFFYETSPKVARMS